MLSELLRHKLILSPQLLSLLRQLQQVGLCCNMLKGCNVVQ